MSLTEISLIHAGALVSYAAGLLDDVDDVSREVWKDVLHNIDNALHIVNLNITRVGWTNNGKNQEGP